MTCLVSVGDFKKYALIPDLSKDFDLLITNTIEYVGKLIDGYVGYKILRNTYTDQDLHTDGVSKMVQLYMRNIQTDPALTLSYQGDIVDTTRYKIDHSYGLVYLDFVPIEGYGELKTTYTAGWGEDPPELPDDIAYVARSVTRQLLLTSMDAKLSYNDETKELEELRRVTNELTKDAQGVVDQKTYASNVYYLQRDIRDIFNQYLPYLDDYRLISL